MEYTQDTFIQLFATTRNKEGLLQYLKDNPNAFVPLLELSLLNTPEAWRGSWLVGHTMQKNDERIQPYVDKLISKLLSYKEGHQRQVLIILINMNLDDEQEGLLFDYCLNIWENIKIIPSTRVTAIKYILKIVDKFPELKPEVTLWTQEMYLDTLSPGIKTSLLKQVKKLI